MIEDIEWKEPTFTELGMTVTSAWKSTTPHEVVNAIHGKNTPEAKQQMLNFEERMTRLGIKIE